MDFIRLGQHPLLDLLNTLPVVGGQQIELLTGDEDVARWAESFLPVLVSLAPGVGEATRELREVLRHVLAEREPTRATLDQLNGWLARLGVPRATFSGELCISPVGDGSELATHLLPLLSMVPELLTGHARGRVRRCANPDCVLWFLDTSKAGRRAWCDMTTCGNLLKARRHRRREANGDVGTDDLGAAKVGCRRLIDSPPDGGG